MRHFLILLIISPLLSLGQHKSISEHVKDTSVNLYVFVGEKISLNQYDPNLNNTITLKFEIDSITGDTFSIKQVRLAMDAAFDAKYRVLKSVFNDLGTDTINFKVFDHYGRPEFENYPIVLLYVSRSEKGDYYVHQKYQFDPLTKRKDGSYRGKKGKSLNELFVNRKRTVFKARGLFK